MKTRWSSGAPVHVLHCFSAAAAAAAAAAADVGGAASLCTYTSFLFNFPFDEIYLSASCAVSAFHFPFHDIYRRLLFFHSRAFCFRVNRLLHN